MYIQLLRWMLVIVWMVLIFIGSSIPAQDFPDAPKQISIVVHFIEFFVLAILLQYALNRGFRTKVKLVSVATAFLVTVFYGFTDEFHQMFVPGRVPDPMDLTINTVGALAACIVFAIVSSRISIKSGEAKV